MNDSDALLSQLRGIHTPPVSAWPAAGWWWSAALIVVLMGLAWFVYRRYQRRGWQREAQIELARLRAQAGTVPASQTLAATSTLVRRVALAARPRQEVASVQGEAWLDTLDSICGKPLFNTGFGRLLLNTPYQRQTVISDSDLDALLDVVSELIQAAGKRTSATTGSLPVNAVGGRS